MLNAFCRVAPSVRFRVFAILFAGTFFLASDFSSRTCTAVQARLFFDPFFIRISMQVAAPFSGKLIKRKEGRLGRSCGADAARGAAVWVAVLGTLDKVQLLLGG